MPHLRFAGGKATPAGTKLDPTARYRGDAGVLDIAAVVDIPAEHHHLAAEELQMSESHGTQKQRVVRLGEDRAVVVDVPGSEGSALDQAAHLFV